MLVVCAKEADAPLGTILAQEQSFFSQWVIIESIEPSSLLAGRVEAGDVLLSINDEDVTDAALAATTIRSAASPRLRILPQLVRQKPSLVVRYFERVHILLLVFGAICCCGFVAAVIVTLRNGAALGSEAARAKAEAARASSEAARASSEAAAAKSEAAKTQAALRSHRDDLHHHREKLFRATVEREQTVSELRRQRDEEKQLRREVALNTSSVLEREMQTRKEMEIARKEAKRLRDEVRFYNWTAQGARKKNQEDVNRLVAKKEAAKQLVNTTQERLQATQRMLRTAQERVLVLKREKKIMLKNHENDRHALNARFARMKSYLASMISAMPEDGPTPFTTLPHMTAGTTAGKHRLGPIPRAPVCPDTRQCPPHGQNRTVFKIVGGESHAAFGNLFYSAVTNGLLYAAHKDFVPWIQFDPDWVYKTMGRTWVQDGPLWERFFQPFCPNVSAWLSACGNVNLAPLKTARWWYPYVQQHAKWAVRQWYNMNSNEAIVCQREGWCHLYNETAYATWRRNAHVIVSTAHRLRPEIEAAVDERWLALNPQRRSPVLGVHLRGSDKASARRATNPSEFEPYFASFMRTHPNGLVVVATDSGMWATGTMAVWRQIWGKSIFVTANISTRVGGRKGNFYGQFDKMVVAEDVLLDIQTLARADFLLHTASAVAEAAIYINPKLHCNSAHLEFEHNASFDAPWLPERRPVAGCTTDGLPIASHSLLSSEWKQH